MPGDMYECDCALWTLAALMTVPPFIPTPPQPTTDILLLEDGTDLLLEDGTQILLD